MRRLIFYVDPLADPLVVASEVRLCLDDRLITTASGSKRADAIRTGDAYRFPEGRVRIINRVEQSSNNGQTWTEVT